MKLNTKAFRYLAPEDWRVLTGVELGSKNHEVVPTPLIIQLSGLRAGSSGATRSISTLAKANLIAKEQNMNYDGYRLTYGGLDYLALHAHTKSNSVVHLGSQMGVGKESDIYLVTSPNLDASGDSPVQHQNVQAILKLHRLGRTSFRSVRNKRSYQGNRGQLTWQHLSRLSAHKEYLAMQALYSAGLPVPRPIAWSRHSIVMSLVPGIPLRQVPLSAFGAEKDGRDERIAKLYGECMELTLKLAELGLIHGDFNEFNILIENVPDNLDPESEDEHEPAATTTTSTSASTEPLIPHLIDFPQITSLSHPQASTFFDRDVDCIKRFFLKRYHFTSSDSGPHFNDATARLEAATAAKTHRRLDVEIEAAGFSRKMAKELGGYYDVADKGDAEHADADQESGASEEGDGASEEENDGLQVDNEFQEPESESDHPLAQPDDHGGLDRGVAEPAAVTRSDATDDGNIISVDQLQKGEEQGIRAEQFAETLLAKLDLSSKQAASIKSSRTKGTKAAAGWSI